MIFTSFTSFIFSLLFFTPFNSFSYFLITRGSFF